MAYHSSTLELYMLTASSACKEVQYSTDHNSGEGGNHTCCNTYSGIFFLHQFKLTFMGNAQ